MPMEGLRAIAVIVVFLHHYAVQAQLIGLAPGLTASVATVFRDYGNYGVDLFFVISGYLIHAHLVARRPMFGRFMRRRFVRIYPAFLVVFGIMLAVNFLIPTYSKLPADAWHVGIYVAANLALLPGLLPITPILAVAWSLSYEMFFYFVAAGLALIFNTCSTSRKGRIVTLLVCSMAFLLASSFAIPHFPDRMIFFLVGMLLAEGLGNGVPPWMGSAAVVLSIGISSTARLNETASLVFQSIMFFFLCAVTFRGAGRLSRWLSWTPLRWLGNMSYSYYLMHGLVIRAGMVALAGLLPLDMPIWGFWIMIPAVFVATLLASGALFVWVEKPLSLTTQYATIPTARPH